MNAMTAADPPRGRLARLALHEGLVLDDLEPAAPARPSETASGTPILGVPCRSTSTAARRGTLRGDAADDRRPRHECEIAAPRSSASSTPSRCTSRARASTTPTTARRRHEAGREDELGSSKQRLEVRREVREARLEADVLEPTRLVARPPRFSASDAAAAGTWRAQHARLPAPPVRRSVKSASRPGPAMSVFTAFGASQLTHGSRTNVLGDRSCRGSRRAPAADAPRGRGRPRSAAAFLRTRANASACARSRWCSPFGRRNTRPPKGCELRRSVAAHVDAAERVDQLGEVLEVDLDDVVDLEPVARGSSRPSRSSARRRRARTRR